MPQRPTPSIEDVGYRATVGDAAYQLAGAGYLGGKIVDLDHKLDLFRTVAGLDPLHWPDVNFAKLIFGYLDADAAAKFNRKKHGRVALVGRDAAALAQLFNALGRLPAEQRKRYSSAAEHRIISEMTGRLPDNSGLHAPDLERPLHEFLGLAALAAAEPGDGEDRSRNLDTAHDRLMAYLNGLSVHSHPSEAVVFAPARGSSERFGDAQLKPDIPIWEQEPVPLKAGEELVVRIPGRPVASDEIWALTVRDPRPPRAGGRAGRYVWQEPWDHLVRWIVPPRPAPMEADAPETLRYGRVVDMAGLFSLFVLIDRGGKGEIRRLVGAGPGGPVPMAGLYRLLRRAAKRRLGFDCYVRRYRVGA